jgi:peptidoglycan/xylan/chitin deacetylase (PgdA/CDA1 family)
VDALGGGGLLAAARKTAIGIALRPRSLDARRRRREARAYLADVRAHRDTAYPIEDMVAAEREHGWRSTCYYLVRHVHPLDGPGEEYVRRLPAAVEAARQRGLEVGLHASYTARERPGAIAEEADRFAGFTGERPRGLRHHYLRSDAAALAGELRLAGIEYDTSIGWAERPGARAGTPYPYRLWDAELAAPGGLELPLFVMDRTLERYLRLDADAALAATVAALEPVAAAGGACAVLWHPPGHHPALSGGYDATYRRLLAWIADRGGFAGTALEVLQRWEGRVPTGG